MSRVESARWQILDALLAAEPEGASREHVLQCTGLAAGSFYRSIKPLLEQGFVLESQGRYRMPLTNLHNYRYKLWKDAERLYQLPPVIAHHIVELVEQGRRELGSQLLALWLVGSAAHDELHEHSDLDFLAVVKKSTMFSPRSPYGVNFVTVRDSEFREKALGGDGFVWTAMRYGLLLEDRGFAQEVLTTMSYPWGTFSPEVAETDWATMENRFLYLARDKDHREAHKTLQSLAVRLARQMLLAVRELPAGKPALLRACELYFGDPFSATVREILESTPGLGLGLARMLELGEALHDYQDRYQANRFRWQAVSNYLGAGPVEFESLTTAMLGHLLPGFGIRPKGRSAGADLVVENQSHQKLLVECKALEREYSAEPFERLEKVWAQERLLVVVNAYRSVPPLHRPCDSWTAEVAARAHEVGVMLVSSAEFWRDYHQVDLNGGEGLSQLQQRLDRRWPGVFKPEQRQPRDLPLFSRRP